MKVMMIIAGVLLAFACHKQQDVPGQLRIEWLEHLEGNYSFAKAWDYPPGVYKNEQGQLSCDGFCPERTDAMKDSTGRIDDDSLSAFYALVDTTHQFHSMQSDAECAEYAGADYMIATRVNDTIVCNSLCNAGTHCSLQLRIFHNTCMASVLLRSIIGKNITYLLQDGYFKTDPELLKKGILKAAFHLDFGKDKRSGKNVYWKGLIYTPILN
jgi:hypothetical protein